MTEILNIIFIISAILWIIHFPILKTQFNFVNKMLTQYEMRQNFLSSLPRFWLEWATIFVMVVLVFYFVSLELNSEKYFVILGVFAASAFRLMPSFSRIISFLQ